MAEQFQTAVRELRGSKNAQRLRRGGNVPAILYGHGQETISLQIPTEEIERAVRLGQRLIELTGAVNENAFIREIQWDAFGIDVLHLDLTRVMEGDTVEVQVKVETRGRAVGLNEGGIVDQLMHSITIECPVMSLPDKIEVNINQLELDGAITVGEVEIPAGATLISDPSNVIVQCMMRLEEEEEGPAVEESEEGVTGTEPELIGKPDEPSEDGDDDSDE